MEFELKPISADAAEAALERAKQYRLLNEPAAAESICLDLLKTDPKNNEARVHLLLALTDQFQTSLTETYNAAMELLADFEDDYNKIYYEGVIAERRGKAHLRRGGSGSGSVAYEWLRTAMDCYEKAEKIRQPGNDESLLRWNSCVRLIDRYSDLKPGVESKEEQMLE